MSLRARLDQLHSRVRENLWFRLFTVFNRLALAAGFIPSGLTKVLGERFTALPHFHPMGQYLDAFYGTGYYYTFVGIMQVLAGLLLLIPRTALLGALIYFPIILNICILSLAVRFDGSSLTAPLMVISNLYLLCWDYHKLKFILPFKWPKQEFEGKATSRKFPFAFAGVVILVVVAVFLNFVYGHELMPRNSIEDCEVQCPDSKNPEACIEFCECIHEEGNTLDECLELYYEQVE